MRKRVQIGFATLLLGLAGLAGWHTQRTEAGPVYQGKSLRSWLYLYNPRFSHFEEGPTPEQRIAEDAIRNIGTNAIPTLLRMLAKKDSAPMSYLIAFWDRHLFSLPIAIRFPAWYRNQASVLNEEAVSGFEILGADASIAAPALIKFYERNVSESSQDAAVRAILAIGPAAERMAIPSFLRAITSSNATERTIATRALCGLYDGHIARQLVVPALVSALSDTNFLIREVAASTLADFETNAQEAVPALIRPLNDPNPQVHIFATNALRTITPSAAAKAGVATRYGR